MILFIDTSQAKSRVVICNEKLKNIAQVIWLAENNLSEELLVKIDAALKKAKSNLTDLTKIFAVVGPGSYTGLRIGLSTANALAFGLQIPIVGLPNNCDKMMMKKAGASPPRSLEPIYWRPAEITKSKAGL